jgi:hypothetical protein
VQLPDVKMAGRSSTLSMVPSGEEQPVLKTLHDPVLELHYNKGAAAHVTCAKYARSVKALQDETGSVSDLDSSLESSACGLKPATAQQLRHQGSLSGAQVPFPSNDLPSRAHP